MADHRPHSSPEESMKPYGTFRRRCNCAQGARAHLCQCQHRCSRFFPPSILLPPLSPRIPTGACFHRAPSPAAATAAPIRFHRVPSCCCFSPAAASDRSCSSRAAARGARPPCMQPGKWLVRIRGKLCGIGWVSVCTSRRSSSTGFKNRPSGNPLDSMPTHPSSPHRAPVVAGRR